MRKAGQCSPRLWTPCSCGKQQVPSEQSAKANGQLSVLSCGLVCVYTYTSTSVFQEKPWPRRLRGQDKVLLVDHDTGTDAAADEPDSQRDSKRTQVRPDWSCYW